MCTSPCGCWKPKKRPGTIGTISRRQISEKIRIYLVNRTIFVVYAPEIWHLHIQYNEIVLNVKLEEMQYL